MKQKFEIEGMTCSACSSHVEKSVNKLSGMKQVSVNLLTNSMQVEYDEEKVDAAAIVQAVERAGYGAAVVQGRTGAAEYGRTGRVESKAEEDNRSMKKRLWTSVLLLIPLMYISMNHMFHEWFGIPVPAVVRSLFHGEENAVTYAFSQLLLLLPILYVNQKFFTVGFKTLFRGSPNMDSLIAIGAGAAVVYGVFALFRIGYGLGHGDMELVSRYSMDIYFESAGTILTLITVGKYLETKSKGKTSQAIARLMDLTPKTAIIERDGVELEIPVEAVSVGNRVIIRPGSSVPVDGLIVQGTSALDESAITGESIPVEKTVGDTVTAATVNKSGYLVCEAARVGEDTTLAQIIRLVEEASASKAPIAKMADRIAGVFVPIVIGIAVLAFVIWLLAGAGFEFAMSIGIAILVISCPCALGLATPVAIMAGTGKGASQGILVKSGEALQRLQEIKTIVFDKTGTLTEGKPEVTDVIVVSGNIGTKQLLQLAVSLEHASEHPLAEAVMEEGRKKGILPQPVTGFQAIFGYGIQAVGEGKQYIAGNMAFMEERGIAVDEEQIRQVRELATAGKTPLIFAGEKELLGIIAVADTVKETSARAIEEFRKLHIKTVMLTGDNEVTAKAIQQELQIEEVIAGVLPAQKEETIRSFQQNGVRVAMVGDGINDAPALAAADVGIAIGAGTDVAIESADIVLMRNDLLDAVTAVRLSKAVIRNIKQNLFWAFFYNVIGIPLAAGVFYSVLGWRLSPMFGAAAMSLSSVCVVLNALRLNLFSAGYNKNNNRNSEDNSPNKRQNNKEDHRNSQDNDLDNHQNKQNNDQEESYMTITVKIEGMMCAHCQAAVEKALQNVEGVEAVTVSLEDKQAVITHAADIPEEQMKEAAAAAVTAAGYEVTE